MKMNPMTMVEYIPEALIGWLCVFIVTAVVIACIWVLNKVTGKKGE